LKRGALHDINVTKKPCPNQLVCWNEKRRNRSGKRKIKDPRCEQGEGTTTLVRTESSKKEKGRQTGKETKKSKGHSSGNLVPGINGGNKTNGGKHGLKRRKKQ